MKERPLLFNAPMVRALLDGSKTQTRRVVKAKHLPWLENSALPGCGAVVDTRHHVGGDRLWVRETWAAPHAFDHLPPRLIASGTRFHYRATEDAGGLLWRPSIHMPRWASRITLEITGVRVERLQDISESDAIAEGCKPNYLPNRAYEDEPYKSGYVSLWQGINGHGSWAANPFVWVIDEFKRIAP